MSARASRTRPPTSRRPEVADDEFEPAEQAESAGSPGFILHLPDDPPEPRAGVYVPVVPEGNGSEKYARDLQYRAERNAALVAINQKAAEERLAERARRMHAKARAEARAAWRRELLKRVSAFIDRLPVEERQTYIVAAMLMVGLIGVAVIVAMVTQ